MGPDRCDPTGPARTSNPQGIADPMRYLKYLSLNALQVDVPKLCPKRGLVPRHGESEFADLVICPTRVHERVLPVSRRVVPPVCPGRAEVRELLETDSISL